MYEKVKTVVFVFRKAETEIRKFKHIIQIYYTHTQTIKKLYILVMLRQFRSSPVFLLHFSNLFKKKRFLFLERHHDYFI